MKKTCQSVGYDNETMYAVTPVKYFSKKKLFFEKSLKSCILRLLQKFSFPQNANLKTGKIETK